MGEASDAAKPRGTYARERQRQQARLRKLIKKRDRACIGCGSSQELQAAHFIPVIELINDVDLEAAHDHRLAAGLCRGCHLVFDGKHEILPEDFEELGGLIETRFDHCVRHLGREPDRADISLLSRSDPEVQAINERMKILLDRARDLRSQVATRMATHLAQIAFREQGPSEGHERRGWLSEIRERIFEEVFSDFSTRNRFFAIEKEHKEIARQAGLHYSRRLRLWYAPSDSSMEILERDKRAREIFDLQIWQQALHEDEQRWQEERDRRLREKAERRQDAKTMMQRAILVAMSTEPMTIREIATAAGLTYGQVNNEVYPNSVSLHAQGLAERHTGHKGRSSAVAYSLTATGKAQADAIRKEESEEGR
ncbi:hypothetical protein [Paraliomyxa miuraensis]|uniref:hypothetical protein n=1 Tax=Paraliomyxa miuraensis TaxID=376150 RepID=UPI00225452AC|nr:hypothetical protein [Paraliomyxa miuraensis]MCX4244191.1 hypothetical protein [Paraliomyxa miuraensis]